MAKGDPKPKKRQKKTKMGAGFGPLALSGWSPKKGRMIVRDDAVIYFTSLSETEVAGEQKPCSIVGVDIGRKHPVFVGIDENAKILCIALLHSKAKTLHEVCDEFDTLLSQNADLCSIAIAAKHRIEQQFLTNPGARMIAASIRTCLRMVKRSNHSVPDVEYISAAAKYSLAPTICPETADDEARVEGITGSKRNNARKKLAIRDSTCIMKHCGEVEVLQFLAGAGAFLDKLDDIHDAYILALCEHHRAVAENLKKKNRELKKVKKAATAKRPSKKAKTTQA